MNHKNTIAKYISVQQLVASGKMLQPYMTVDFILAEVKINRFFPWLNGDYRVEFDISGFGHGIALVKPGNTEYFHLHAYTGKDFTYTEYYGSRHGYRELRTILSPFLQSKVLPLLENIDIS